MLNKNEAINSFKLGRTFYTFKCENETCSQTILVRSDALKTHSKKCAVHAHCKKPFEALYNGMLLRTKTKNNTLSYEDFLYFTKINDCHYCLEPINWIPYREYKGKNIGQSYFLDRKDNSLGYFLTNCVVCCTKCNYGKGDRYSYAEWYGMTSYFRRIKNEK